MSIEMVVQTLQDTLQKGQSIQVLVDAWMEKDPQVIAEIVLSQRIQNALFAETILTVAPQLEVMVPPEDLYLALAPQMRLNKHHFLDWLFEHHATAMWLPSIAKILEGSNMGYYHLLQKHHAHSRDLPMWCYQYASMGARDGIVAFAEDTGNPIPAAILYGLNDHSSGLKAAVGAFKRNPKSPVLEFLAGRIGPDLDQIVLQIIAALEAENHGCPATLKLWRSAMIT